MRVSIDYSQALQYRHIIRQVVILSTWWQCVPRLYFGSLQYPIFWGISGCPNDLKLVKNRWDRHEVRLSRCQSTIYTPFRTVISFGKYDITLTLRFKLTSNTLSHKFKTTKNMDSYEVNVCNAMKTIKLTSQISLRLWKIYIIMKWTCMNSWYWKLK